MIEPRSRRIALDTGIGCHLLEWGADVSARDHTLVLVHGFLDLSWGWCHTVEAGLADRFHVIAPDMRGHGDSDRIGAGGYYHFLDYIADLRSIVRRLGRARVSLVGHSMGGTITSYYAGSFPDQVHKLALLEGMGPPERPQMMPERMRVWIAGCERIRARPPRSYANVEKAAERLRKNDPLLGAELARWLAEKGTVESPDGGRRFKHDPLHLTLGPYPFQLELAQQFWREIRCPVLLVDGSESSFRRRADEQRRRETAIADRRNVTITGAAHMMQRHQPAALAEQLIEFFDEP